LAIGDIAPFRTLSLTKTDSLLTLIFSALCGRSIHLLYRGYIIGESTGGPKQGSVIHREAGMRKNIAIETFAIPLFLAIFVLGSSAAEYFGNSLFGIGSGTAMLGFILLAVFLLSVFRKSLY
jgi:hypothetical protein